MPHCFPAFTDSFAPLDDFAVPPAGASRSSYWCTNSTHAADHAAAGDVEGALRLLSRQIAAVNFAPLQANVMALVQGATSSLPGLTQLPSLKSSLQRNGNAPEKASLLLCILQQSH
jgi:coatomer subunit alpha